nr:fructosamine kinase family protein [Anaerolineae bacterium]
MKTHMPESLLRAVEQSLADAGRRETIHRSSYTGGGDINQAALVETDRGRYFVKWHNSPPPRFFECESAGLQMLGDTGAVKVPRIVAHGSAPGSSTAYLILEWVQPGRGKSQKAAEVLGRQLAHLHQKPWQRYGLPYDNYIGRLPQPNHQMDSWVNFYASERLGAQRDQARRAGLLPRHRADRLDTLIAGLDRWIDDSLCRPSLLHGDLWGGNWMVNADDEPVLIDPAVYVGDREADLAMTTLFGGFPQVFYDAYQEVYPLEPGYHDRQPLYRLYYLLCHLNLFGEGYGGSVDSILARFVA